MDLQLEIGKCYILNKKMKVKFGTVVHHSEGLLDCIQVDVWSPTCLGSNQDCIAWRPLVLYLFYWWFI